MTAAGAEAVQFEAVGLDGESVAGGDFLLELLDLAVFKFDDLAAAGADEMVVVSLVRHVIVLGLCAEMAGLGNTRIAEQVQRSIDGGQPQVGIALGELVIHRFCCDVFLPEKGVENELPLTREFQLVFRQVLLERVHFFSVLT